MVLANDLVIMVADASPEGDVNGMDLVEGNGEWYGDGGKGMK